MIRRCRHCRREVLVAIDDAGDEVELDPDPDLEGKAVVFVEVKRDPATRSLTHTKRARVVADRSRYLMPLWRLHRDTCEKVWSACRRTSATPRYQRLFPGWLCCGCRAYNGFQRLHCRSCGHESCFAVDGEDEVFRIHVAAGQCDRITQAQRLSLRRARGAAN